MIFGGNMVCVIASSMGDDRAQPDLLAAEAAVKANLQGSVYRLGGGGALGAVAGVAAVVAAAGRRRVWVVIPVVFYMGSWVCYMGS